MRTSWYMIMVFLCLAHQVDAQENNHVPNPSFEAHTTCPNSSGMVGFAEPWYSVYGSVDYYLECGTNGYDIPVSIVGGGYARTGEAYTGLALGHMAEFVSEAKEYVGVPLKSSLSANARYRIVFYVSLCDSTWYAAKNIGAYLSIGPPQDDITSLLAIEPHVRYEGEEFLTDKEGWTRIEGTYLAQGGENFLTIGNFDNDATTETVFVEGGAVPHPSFPEYWRWVCYFIDDVSVIDVDSLVGIEAVSTESISIYPNPTRKHFTIETEQGNGGTLRLLDMAGREVLLVALQSSRQSVAIEGIPAGVYVAVVEQQGTVIARKKVLVE